MSENSSTASTSNSSWLETLYSEDYLEESENTLEYVRLLPNEARKIVWELAKDLVGPENALSGIASLACQLFERYLAVFIRTYRTMSPESREWHRSKLVLQGKSKMLVCVCIRLATKTICHQVHITTTSLQRLKEPNFSIQDINQAEQEVFKALNFRIPLRSNVEKARMLSQEVGLTGQHLVTAGLIMDIVDFYREGLQKDIIEVVCRSFSIPLDSVPSDSGITASSSSDSPVRYERYISNMHLIGGVVAATARFLSAPIDPVPKLACLVRTNSKYIKCIRNVILILITKTRVPKRQNTSSNDESDVSYGKRRRC